MLAATLARPVSALVVHLIAGVALGAAGVLVRRFPQLEVWVHEVGARHVVDPSKLIASATRLYGDDMEVERILGRAPSVELNDWKRPPQRQPQPPRYR